MSTVSKCIATVITYPYQVVRSRLQDIRGDSTGQAYRSVRDVLARIFRYEGWLGLYKGLGPNLIRTLPGTCVTFVAYEQISHAVRALNGPQ